MLNRIYLTHWDSDDGLDVSDSHVHTTRCFALFPQLHVELLYDIDIFLIKLGMARLPGVADVFLEKCGVDGRICVDSFRKQIVFQAVLLFVGVIFDVWVYHECAKIAINLLVHLITNHIQDVESRKDWFWQIDVLTKWELRVISPLQRIGCSNDRTPGSQCCNYTCLWNWNWLLLHGFVDWSAIVLTHFIEFVYEADSLVC